MDMISINVMFISDGPTETIITNDLNCIRDHLLKTFGTVTIGVLDGVGFTAKDIGFENTTGDADNQAAAFRATCDMVIMFNCHFNGY
ncbi:putative pectinesterase/pectinesterase inhibitor 43 [Gossypium hirsutum]|uniref:Pectinesterase/pectinesterase inhibitor 43 n=1 Tax=Gossypium hirsutum TaxID=3635 RepID=A0ABM2YRX7_GOSHI|nr:putative pectinesterase/pectinesterase inhibitor 43 [Gossypium hirsutum]